MVARPVLVVDDDPENRRLMAQLLSSEGYAVATASNGREALKNLPDARPFVILLDLEMPVMDGRTFRQHQLQLAPALRSIPGSCAAAQMRRTNSRPSCGRFARLSKPLPDFSPLLEQVEAAYQLSA